MTSLRMSNLDATSISKNWGWFLVWGIALVVLGMFAISAAAMTTLLSVIFIGFLLLISGAFIIIDTFTFWRGKGSGFFLHLMMGLLYLAAGVILIGNPVQGSVSLTLLLGVLYTCLGIFRIFYGINYRMLRWGWSLVSGIVTLLLGILILASWPDSSLFIIGLFVGIDLLFCGWAYIMVAFMARNYQG